MIEACELHKSYGEVAAVKGISFKVQAGEVVGLLGPNGAGKTTTMRMLTTFIPPSAGTALIAGCDVQKDAAGVRKLIGYLPETPPLYPDLKVREYLIFCAKIRGVQRRAVRASVDLVLERCALGNVALRLCGHLSRGYKQRVGLAQALVHNPRVVILDEPTAGLDPSQIVSTRQLIAELRKDHTVVISTHILREVEETCTSAIIIANGRLVVQGSIAELTAAKSLEQCFLESVTGDVQ
jgi:ABC-2 type transport system ATP-binding protein